jgi:hypothetical protein
MVAIGLGLEPLDGETRVELQTGARRFARLFGTTDIRQRCGEAKMSCGRIRIELFRPVQPFELLISVEN